MTTQQTLTPDAARTLGYQHGQQVPDSPTSTEQARSDAHEALPADAPEDVRDAYLEGHLQGQAA